MVNSCFSLYLCMELLIFSFSLYGITELLRFSFQPQQILSFWGRVLASIPETLAKPLGDCRYCFGFWFSLAVSLMWFGFVSDSLLVVGCVQGFLFLNRKKKDD